MAGEWEDVGTTSTAPQWEPVGSKSQQFEEAPLIERALKAPTGAIESYGRGAANLVTGTLGQGLGSLYGLATSGGDLNSSIETGQKVAGAMHINPWQGSSAYFDEQTAKGLEFVREKFGEQATSAKKYQNLDQQTLDTLKDEAANRGIAEGVFDNVILPAILGKTMPGKVKAPELSPEAQRYLAERQAKEQNGPIAPGPGGGQMELPGMERPSLETPEQMAARLQDQQTIKQSPQGEQLGLWEPVGEKKGPIVSDQMNEAMLADLGIKAPEKPAAFPERNAGDIDFPFRQEALERDPHIYDLREQYQAAVDKGELRRAKAILADAENYLDSSYNIRSTLGPMYKSGEGTALPIESARQGTNRINISAWEGLQESTAKFADALDIPKGQFENPKLAGVLINENRPRVFREALDVVATTSKIPFYRELSKLLLKDKDFNPSFEAGLSSTGPEGRYRPSAHKILTKDTRIGNEFVIMHEAVHARTFAALEYVNKNLKGADGHRAVVFANRIKDLYNSLGEAAKNVANWKYPMGDVYEAYGFKNLHEFVAEGFSNPEFQLLLKQIELPEKLQTKGLKFYWDSFVHSISEVLGLRSNQKQTYMSALIEAGVGLMQNLGKEERTAFVLPEHLKNIELGSPPRDPKMEAFKDSLPEALKGEAKQLYKEYTKQQEPRPEVVTNENALTAAKDIPGMKDIFAEVAPIEKSVEELKPFILKEEDLGGSKMAQLGRQMVAGVKLLGFGSQNTVIRFGGQMVDNALRRAEKFMREEVTKKDTGLKPTWEKLTSKEQDSLWPAMIAAEGKEVLSKERLLQLGMSDKQIAAYGKYRSVMDKVFEKINQARALVGKGPIPARQGYIMSRFLGDFKIDVVDSEGKRIHMIGATTQWGAERAAAVMRERYPNLTFSKPRHEPTHRIGSTDDVNKGYQALLGLLDEQDPRVAAIESTMQEYTNNKGYDALGYKRHFIPKSETPVKGFEGNKEWLTQRENTRQGLHATMVYIDQAMRWAELQEANQTIKKLLTDKDITEKQPNSTDFVKNYFDQAAGRSKGLTRAIDTISDFVAENTGIGHSLQTRSLRETKQFFTSLYLGFWNLGFSASQILQPVQMMPAWLHYLRQQGATKALPQALAMGMRDAIWYGFNNDKMTPFGREAMKHADEYGITDAHFLDDVRSINESKVHDWYTKLTTYNMTAPEKVARRMTYMMFAHFLNENGAKKRTLFETASNLTDMAMVDYRLHERANMYKMLGVVGESASALTTFKHNYYSQMWALGKRGGTPVVANMIGMTMLFAGLMGFYGREEVDAIINLINEVSTKRVPTLTETILKTPDTVAFGGLSAATGLDMSPKFSMSNIFPDNLSKAIFPFGTTSANVATLGAGLVNNPTQSQGMRIANELAPGPVKALTEGYFSTPERTLNPKTMEGKYDRNTFEKAARFGSVRSIKESRAIQENYQKKNADAFYVTQRQNIAKNAKDLYFEGKMSEPKWKELANNYVKNEGKVEELVNEVVSNLKDQKQSEARRTLMESLGRPTRYKRLEDMTQGGFKGTGK